MSHVLYRLEGYNHASGTFVDAEGAFTLVPENVAVIATYPPNGYVADDGPEAWVDYRMYIEGNFQTAMDYLAIRTHIMNRIESITGTNYANYGNLSQTQATVALKWCNIRIANELSLATYYALCGSAKIGSSYISEQLQAAFNTRHIRYVKFKTLLYSKLGKFQGLLVESVLRADSLIDQYIQNGVVQFSVDTVPGIGDFVQGRNPYTTTGILPRLLAGTLIANPGTNPDIFAAVMENLLLTGDL